MKEESKKVRLLLAEVCPDEKFAIHIKHATGYSKKPDRIQVKCRKETNKEMIISKIRQYVEGVSVVSKGTKNVPLMNTDRFFILPYSEEIIHMDTGIIEVC